MQSNKRILISDDLTAMAAMEQTLASRIGAAELQAAGFSTSISTLQQVAGGLAQSLQTTDAAALTLKGRVDAHDLRLNAAEQALIAQALRITSVEGWRGNLFAFIPKIGAQLSAIGISILGVSISVARADALKTVADKVDVIIDCLAAREISKATP